MPIELQYNVNSPSHQNIKQFWLALKGGTLERGTLERGTLERGTLERGTLERGTQERGMLFFTFLVIYQYFELIFLV